MKATKQMIDAASAAHPGLQREQVALVVQAALDSDCEPPRPGLMKISVLFIVLCGLLAAIYAVLPLFVGFDELATIGFGLMAFLVIGGAVLICAWLVPRKTSES